MFEHFNHFSQHLVQKLLKLIIVTAENNECDPLHGVTLLKNDSVVICKQASLDVPFLHQIFKYLIWLAVDDILHDLLPVLHVEHAELEECVNIEKRDNVVSVWLDQAGVNRMRPFNDGGEEIGYKFVHHIFGDNGRFTLIFILNELDNGNKHDVNRLIEFLIVAGSYQIDQNLAQKLLQSEDAKEASLLKHFWSGIMSTEGKFYFFHKVRLLHVIFR